MKRVCAVLAITATLGFGADSRAAADEVAVMTGMTPGHVRVLQHRALRSLRRHLEARSDGGL